MEAYQELELAWGKYTDGDHVVACSSGTAALHLALEALALPLGSEVVLPDFTMVSCARAVAMAGLVPVFVDCTPRLVIDPALVETAVTPRTRAVMAVHVYGRSCDMPALADVCGKYDLYLLEDSAEAHGLPPHPSTDATCWSFYRNKIVAGEEGGAVAFACGDLAKRAKKLRSVGFTEEHDYTHIPRGHNYRLANCLARQVLDSLKNVDANQKTRREMERVYDAKCPEKWRMPYRDCVWVYDVRIAGMTPWAQSEAVRQLNRASIAARHGFKPMSSQKEFRGCRRLKGDSAALAAREVIYLPVNPGTDAERTAERAFDVLQRTLA